MSPSEPTLINNLLWHSLTPYCDIYPRLWSSLSLGQGRKETMFEIASICLARAKGAPLTIELRHNEDVQQSQANGSHPIIALLLGWRVPVSCATFSCVTGRLFGKGISRASKANYPSSTLWKLVRLGKETNSSSKDLNWHPNFTSYIWSCTCNCRASHGHSYKKPLSQGAAKYALNF